MNELPGRSDLPPGCTMRDIDPPERPDDDEDRDYSHFWLTDWEHDEEPEKL